MAFLGSPARTQLDITSKEIQQQATLYRGGFLIPFPPNHMFLLIFLYQQEQLSDLMASQFKELRSRTPPPPALLLSVGLASYPGLPWGQTNAKCKHMGAGENAQPA